MRRVIRTTKPKNKTWSTAKLFDARFYDSRWPVCGQRMVWAVVGHKWVRVCTPVQQAKFRMRRADWDKLGGLRKIA